MAKYTKDNARIVVQFIDADTDEILFQINDRNILNVGELFSLHVMNNLIQNELKGKAIPNNVMIVAVSEYSLTE